MSGFGENLRREREMRGISLQEISDTTKVSVRLLEALEAEQFGKLPGGIYARSFIRSYASYIGLDPEQVLAEYQLVAPARPDEDFSRLGVTGNPSKHAPRAPVLPWIVAVILLGAGYFIFRYSHRAADEVVTYGSPPPVSAAAQKRAAVSLRTPLSGTPPVLAQSGASSAAPGQSTASPLPGSTAPAGSSLEPVAVKRGTGVIPGASAGAVAATAPSPSGTTAGSASVANSSISGASTGAASEPVPEAQGELVLQVAATAPAWVSVKADGKVVLQRTLNPNDVRTLTAKSSFDVVTGNAQATVLTLNGVTLKPLGGFGEVESVHLTRNDIKSSGQ